MDTSRTARIATRWWWRPRAAALFVGAAVVGFGILPVSAATDPFTSNTHGFDVSYPNCTSSLPLGDSFAIVGVTDGRPFTTYRCLDALWKKAEKDVGATPSLYFNTGYSGAYGRDIFPVCAYNNASLPSGLTRHALQQAQRAWEIGCSEAYYGLQNEPGGAPTMWFADVETGNSWSNNVTLNQSTIDGISWEMSNLGSPQLGGIYSSAAMWTTITGSARWSPSPPVSANWLAAAGGNCPSSSSSSPFDSASPTWLAQGAASPVDTDTAC